MQIDRSKPLPIHQFPSLIAKVAELQKRYAEEAAPSYTTPGDEFGYECQALNDMPNMLAALSHVRAGDADDMEIAIAEFRKYGDQESRRIRDTLRRYQELARLVEGKP